MLLPLLIGTLAIFVNMLVQVLSVVVLIRFFVNRRHRNIKTETIFTDMWVLAFALIVLFAGNVFQFTIWASLFMYLGEFPDFATAFYHSTVNFASLGYGDIVMSEDHRLLGALEAINGVLMIGVSTAAMMTVFQSTTKKRRGLGSEKLIK